MKQIAVFLAEGFEEIEGRIQRGRVLRRIKVCELDVYEDVGRPPPENTLRRWPPRRR